MGLQEFLIQLQDRSTANSRAQVGPTGIILLLLEEEVIDLLVRILFRTCGQFCNTWHADQ